MNKLFGNWTGVLVLVTTLGIAYCLKRWPRFTLLMIALTAITLYVMNPMWFKHPPSCNK